MIKVYNEKTNENRNVFKNRLKKIKNIIMIMLFHCHVIFNQHYFRFRIYASYSKHIFLIIFVPQRSYIFCWFERIIYACCIWGSGSFFKNKLFHFNGFFYLFFPYGLVAFPFYPFVFNRSKFKLIDLN
ncbi:hypothetical protein H311_01534 [Anncaliia algerae PRA109]|nr:hypothetical protein H311_01534 [Anncaliia algerae PRA109]